MFFTMYSHQGQTKKAPMAVLFILLPPEFGGKPTKLHSTKHSCLLRTVGEHLSSSQQTCISRCRSNQTKQHKRCPLEPSTRNLQQMFFVINLFVSKSWFCNIYSLNIWYLLSILACLFTHTCTHTVPGGSPGMLPNNWDHRTSKHCFNVRCLFKAMLLRFGCEIL